MKPLAVATCSFIIRYIFFSANGYFGLSSASITFSWPSFEDLQPTEPNTTQVQNTNKAEAIYLLSLKHKNGCFDRLNSNLSKTSTHSNWNKFGFYGQQSISVYLQVVEDKLLSIWIYVCINVWVLCILIEIF